MTKPRRGNPPSSPWAGGPERLPDGAPARNTVSRKLRLRPEEDTALVRVATARWLDLNRAAGALALEEVTRIDGYGREIDHAEASPPRAPCPVCNEHVRVLGPGPLSSVCEIAEHYVYVDGHRAGLCEGSGREIEPVLP